MYLFTACLEQLSQAAWSEMCELSNFFTSTVELETDDGPLGWSDLETSSPSSTHMRQITNPVPSCQTSSLWEEACGSPSAPMQWHVALFALCLCLLSFLKEKLKTSNPIIIVSSVLLTVWFYPK